MVPVDRLHEAVDVLEELPGEPALPDAALAGDRDQPDAPVTRGGVIQVLEQPQLVVASDERRFDRLGAAAPAPLGDDAQGAPCGHRRRLPLEELVPGRLEGDRPGRRVHRCLADQHDVGRGRTLQPAGGVDHVPGDHSLADGPDRHGGLARHDTHPRVDRRAQAAHAAHDLQGGAHGALRVVLVAGGGAPDGHHGVTDELLDRAAVALDHPAREVEVAGEQVADLFRVPVLGERREAHQVGEEDGYQTPLGDRGRGRRRRVSGGRSAGQARAAFPAKPRAGRVRRAARRACGGQRCPALETELAARVVVRAAGGTDHRNLSLALPEERTVDHRGNRSLWCPGPSLAAPLPGPGAAALSRAQACRALPSAARGRLGPGGLSGLQNRCGRA